MSANFEQRVIILLLQPMLPLDEEQELIQLLKTHGDWSAIIGKLIVYRSVGIAYKRLEYMLTKMDIKEFAYKKIYNILKDMYRVQFIRLSEQAKQVYEIAEAFEKAGVRYSVLKGLALAAGLYQDLGSRSSNDMDVMVHPDELEDALHVLRECGYIQGELNILKDVIEPASRRDVVTRPMVSHEVIPFQKKVENNPFMTKHEVDLQFSIDLMTSNRTDVAVDEFLSRRILIETKEGAFHSLSWEDHFLFLCVHFYKEASTDYALKLYNDLSLYKLCDLIYLLNSTHIELIKHKIMNRAKEYGLEKAVFYAMHYLQEAFNVTVDPLLYGELQPPDIEYIHQLYRYNSTEVVMRWNEPIRERIFNLNRVGGFMEVAGT
ncbi:hypothetical protein BC351_39120 [Paenibacillus ferrarius]|uniref:Nucleotidyltransferase n=1 Tax=Paenibacillus ferrarius TaxID=1469647 RepID=A0A1V4HAD8_9BACL|nr:nucleotidyltransferase family protein [Paenibacillus ferrarius]OPH48002.1 hypothetical protein BC351_39120 [Paenibacillus ferrarius]